MCKIKEETVTVSYERWIELIKTEIKMDCLIESGIDNWEWYSEVLKECKERLKEFDL